MKQRILIFTLLICTISVSMPVNAASKAGGYCCLDDKSWKCIGKGRTPADYCEQFKRSNKETGYVELKVREKRYKECVTSLQNLLKNGQCISTEDPKEVADYITGRKNLKDNPPSLNIEGEK